LILTLWDGVRDASSPQEPTTLGVAVALVGQEVVGSFPLSAFNEFTQAAAEMFRKFTHLMFS
jgi:hypothetical protein